MNLLKTLKNAWGTVREWFVANVFVPVPTKINVMIDLETLGVAPGCKVLSLGAVVFTPTGIAEEFYCVIDRDSQAQLGLWEDKHTVNWWLQQNEEAREAVFSSEFSQPVQLALARFTGFITSVQCRYSKEVNVWGNGAGFDLTILAAVYRHAAELPLPWKFRNERCYRTIRNTYPGIPYIPPTIPHHALEDAKAQARHLVRLLNRSEAGWE